MNQRRFLIVVAMCLAAALLVTSIRAEDWPAYKKDPARSGVTAESLSFPLAERWVYQPSQPPKPAWPEPGKELNRTDFDYAFQPVIAEGFVYFGSSADDTVRALHAKTGKPIWRAIMDGPVRFAPTIARGKAYVVSDDSFLYCLDAKTGKHLWRFRAGPGSDRIIGNDRLIARYPCRSGALVVDNVVYVTAGMWPTEGVYVYALEADTGKELWCNDSSGNIYVDLPHAVANGFSGVAPQGYLVASEHVLLVPTGRSVPAAFDRHTGRLLHYKPEKTHYHGASYGGGVWCTAVEDLYFHTNNRSQNPSEAHIGEAEPSSQDGMIIYPLATGDQLCHLPGKYRVLVSGDVVYAAGNGSIEAIDLNVVRQNRRVGPNDARWTTPHPARVYCLAMAGGTLLTGNRDSIAAFDAADGKPVWRVDMKGQQVRGMAVADGRLVAATHTGDLLCFDPGKRASSAPTHVKDEPGPPNISDEQKEMVKDIVQRSGKSEGYALVVGEPDSRLAEALARQTPLHVVALIRDAAQVTSERERLLDVGIYGSRVDVHPEHLRLPPYFADLVVVSGPAKGVSAAECYRVLRPCGGLLCFLGVDDNARKEFISNAEIPRTEVEDSVVIRGKLPGAGEWRYPWADGGRRGIGSESRVRFPIEVLWFGGPGPGRFVDRHLMPSPPVSTNGRVFIQGQNHVVAFDAYNGRELWSQPIEEVGREYAQYYSSSLVADDDSVYVVQRHKCYRLDQDTGKTISTYTIPESVIKETAPPTVPDYVDVQWPEAWQVVGPFPKGKPPLSHQALKTVPQRVSVDGKPYVASELKSAGDIIDFTTVFDGYDLKPLGPGEKPATHPRRGKRFSYHDVGRISYAFATINCPKAGKLLIGAGADWGMQWYLDGELVFNALRNDSSSSRRGFYNRQPCSPKDEFFDVDVTAGEHVLAVMVTAGSRGWALASASMAGKAKELMPVATGTNPNVPNLRDLVWGYLSVTDGSSLETVSEPGGRGSRRAERVGQDGSAGASPSRKTVSGLVLGSYNVPVTEGQPAESHLLCRSESKALFALDKKDGSLRWVYRPGPNRIVANIEIAFGDGRLFLIDGTSKADLVRARRRNQKIKAELTLVALDLVDGSELWRQDDVPMLGDRSVRSRLKTNITHLFMGQPSWGHLVYADGVVLYGANATYDTATGKKIWQKTISPGKLPVIYGDRIITSATAFDLRTGEQCMAEDVLTGESVPWRYPRAYGCGPVAGCQNMLFFRSGADGFFDMETEGTTNFGGVRAGCARTLLAANGLLIHPQGYSGCGCSYNYKTNLAFISAPDRGDTWYVFPRRASSGLIKHMAVNFGAPGDRKDERRTAWLGFPRPMLDSACPAPLTVSLRQAACTYRRRATEAIENTDAPWVYSSGLFGQGRIAMNLVLAPGVVLPRRDAAPAVDGKLDDACWKDVKAVPFQNTPFSMLGAKINFRMFRDAENIYFGYHCPHAANTPANEVATPGSNDGLEIYVADSGRRAGIHLVIGRNGQATATFGTVETGRKVDPNWKGQWQSQVQETADGWAAEVALPIKTLTESRMDLRRLQLNCMAQSRTPSGFESVFLSDPLYGTKFRSCVGFRRVVPAPAQRPKPRSFTVRLHFAEFEDARPGQRVFDVAVQDKTVLEGLDIVREAGGPNRALVKKFSDIAASEQIVIELTPKSWPTDDNALPVISGVEVTQQD